MNMTRWITFDRETAAAMRSHLPDHPVFEAPGRSALEYALSSSGSVVALVPSALESSCGIAVFRPARTLHIPRNQRVLRPSGFLGLQDEAVFDEEAAPPRNWWQKLWS
jgi:hypothetical protein